MGDSRVALVTGAGGGNRGGIGSGIARCLGRAGAAIAVNDLDREYAQRTTDELVEMGVNAVTVEGDISDPDVASSVVAQTAAAFGSVDVLVNNAGVGGRASTLSMEPSEWSKTIAVNLSAAFYLSQAALRYMVDSQWGRIINVASVAGIRVSLLSGPAYTASKSGLLGLTRHMAMEVGTKGVTVNAILPGLTETPLMLENTSEELRGELKTMAPIQRAASPEDHGALAVFLVSESASYLTGAAIPVDGGVSLLPGNFNEYERARSARP